MIYYDRRKVCSDYWRCDLTMKHVSTNMFEYVSICFHNLIDSRQFVISMGHFLQEINQSTMGECIKCLQIPYTSKDLVFLGSRPKDPRKMRSFKRPQNIRVQIFKVQNSRGFHGFLGSFHGFSGWFHGFSRYFTLLFWVCINGSI